MSPSKKRLHFKDLDAMRFFAFLPVMLFCYFKHLSIDQEGFLNEMSNLLGFLALNSLDFFFCVSAFLLASHGLREYKYRNEFSMRNFLIRRLIRIFFLLILLLLFTFLGHPWLIEMLKLQPISVPSPTYYFAFVPNFLSSINSEQFVYLAVTCTIYMFLQYYFLLGIILKFLKPYFVSVSIIFICIGAGMRIFHMATDSEWTFDPLSHLTSVGLGMYAAYLVRSESAVIEKIKTTPKRLIMVVYGIGITSLLMGYLMFANGFGSAFVPLLTCTFFSFMFIEQTYGKNSLFKLRNSRIASHLGKISFGLIVYQAMISVLVLIAMGALDLDLSSDFLKLLGLLVSFILTWIISDVSYNLIERPLLVIRKEFKKI